jgi:hypothetical protein
MDDKCNLCKFVHTWLDWHCITCSEDGDMFQPQQQELFDKPQSRAAFKKRVHEAKADPEGFKDKYGPRVFTTGGTSR